MKISTLLIISLFAILFTGCIYENLSDCPVPSNYTLYFQYNGDGDKDIFSDKIKKVNLYIFDEKDQLLQIQEVGHEQLIKKQGIDLFLEEGVYKVVGWGNVFRNTTVQQVSTPGLLSSWYVYPPNLFTGGTIMTNDSIYFGTRIIECFENARQTDTLHFSSAHINMEIYIEGWETNASRSGITPRIEVDNLFSMYDFQMQTLGEKVSYYPQVELDSKRQLYTGKLNVKRFPEENDIHVYLRDTTNQIHFSLALQDFIVTNDIKIEGKQEVSIPIYIKFQGINVNVSVAVWDSIEGVKPSL